MELSINSEYEFPETKDVDLRLLNPINKLGFPNFNLNIWFGKWWKTPSRYIENKDKYDVFLQYPKWFGFPFPITSKKIQIWSGENGSIFNQNVRELEQKCDLFIFVLKGSEPNYINYKIPTIPVIIEKKDTLIICITPLNFYRCNGFPETKLLDLNQIKTRFVRIFGGYLTNLSKTESDETFVYTEENGFGGVNKISNLQLVNPNYTQIYNRNLHGWMPVGTIFMLKLAIESYQPKVIVELGSWLGRSTSHIVEFYKRLKSSLKLISVDYFFNYFIRGKVDSSPLDRFYMNFDKYTTFHSNLSDVVNEKIKVFTMEGDVRNIIHEIKKNNERVEMVFIDSIKKSHELSETIEDIFRKYPDVVIVGDDFIHPTVMRGVKDAARKLRIRYISNLDSYIMTRRKLPNIHDEKYEEIYESLVLKGKTSKYYDVMIAINNKIDDEVILEMIKERELSMNQGIFINVSDLNNYTMGDTLYHLITRLHRKIPKIFEEHEKPKKVYNLLFLTYLDYIEYNIEFQ